MHIVEFLLALFKFAGIILTGIFGAIGIVVEYKDAKTGQVTIWGRRALIGVIVTSVVAVVSSALEMVAKQREAEKTARQTLNIRSEINRTIHPIEEIKITAWVTIPMEDERLTPYYNSLVAETKKFVDQLTQDENSHSNGILRLESHSIKNDGTIDLRTVTVTVEEGSILDPPFDQASLPYFLLQSLDVGLAVYRSAISPDKFRPYVYSRLGGDPDLRISASPAQLDIAHEVGTDLVELIGWDMTARRKFWQVSGKVVSLPDLYGSQVFFWLGRTFNSQDQATNIVLSDLRKKRFLKTVKLRVSDREFWFREEDLVRHVDKGGHPFWEMRLPSDPQGFTDLLN